MTDVLRAAAEWLAIDPDEGTRAELEALIARAAPTDDGPGDLDAHAELRDRFAGRLRFGTAGLRGELGAGPNRMNRVVVVQTTAGLARFLLDRAERARHPHVVVGYDGRRDSDVFAVDTAEVLAGAGLEVTLLPTALPTPVLAFAVRLLGASAGVMITASHNPPHDNGYKLYLGDADEGSQLVSPDDRAVLAEIDRVVDGTPFASIPRSDVYRTAGDEVVAAYVGATVAAVPVADGPDPRWVYTPMHGVGLDVMQRVVAAAGVTAPVVVLEQAAPDGRFPTVAFPNPEEPGALDLAFQTAYDAAADLIIANDPDADRLAVAVHDRHGAWEALSGNEIGLLLAWSAASRAVAEGRRGTLAASLVSSPGLRAVADHFGLGHRETPTGFKHISRAPDLLFGFEEALGYLVDPDVVRDKDGISAALMLLGMWRSLAADGRDLESLRAEVDRAIGCFASAQVSVRVDRLERIRLGMAALRAEPPTDIGGIRVAAFDDLLEPDGDLPPTDALRFWLEQGARVIVRPSGTEPKLKLYIDVVARTGDVAERRRDARRILTVLQLAAEELVSGV